MEQQTLWILAITGTATLIGIFFRMTGGFGPMYLRAIGIVLIAMFTSILAVTKSTDISAALGILGAIAGYLFGTQTKEASGQGGRSGVEITGSPVLTDSKVAGGDIIETINNLQAKIESLSEFMDKELSKLDLVIQTQQTTPPKLNYLINTISDVGPDEIYRAIGGVIGDWASQGFSLVSIARNYSETNTLMLVFSHHTEGTSESSVVSLYSGYGSNRVYEGTIYR